MPQPDKRSGPAEDGAAESVNQGPGRSAECTCNLGLPDRIFVAEPSCCLAARRARARARIEAIDEHRRNVRALDRFLEVAA